MQQEAYCQIHREYVIQYLIPNKNSAVLACAACVAGLQDEKRKVTFDNILLLHEIQNNPQKIISILANVDQNYTELSNKYSLIPEEQIKCKFQQWQNTLRQFQKWIDQLIIEYKQQLDQAIQEAQTTIKIVKKELKCDDLWNLIKQLQNQNGQRDIQDQIQCKIQIYFEDLQKNSVEIIKKIINQKENDSKNLQKKEIILPDEKEIQQKFQQQSQSILDLNMYIRRLTYSPNAPLSNIVPYDYQQQLLSLIEQRTNQKINKINQIYIGSKDGLNSQALWSKINLKQNLLFIFKSKNPGNSIFGGYANCKFNGYLNGYASDDTASSFIFSYTKNEIFPLKQEHKQSAIWCQQNGYAVYFGSNGDINISTDFINGSSDIGQSYSWNENQGGNNTYLYGGDKPNIEECEVFEIEQ
ncbi:unnamed protein product [Paramecium primaurelia]|uniref:TLDc domain-containing protein n=1 Tax=Paramecium primaurelia TaxID=5886 RepID=A0A8S1P1L0_PARPR|nr:unnamed protein product [Paramecium primaurelia]